MSRCDTPLPCPALSALQNQIFHNRDLNRSLLSSKNLEWNRRLGSRLRADPRWSRCDPPLPCPAFSALQNQFFHNRDLNRFLLPSKTLEWNRRLGSRLRSRLGADPRMSRAILPCPAPLSPHSRINF